MPSDSAPRRPARLRLALPLALALAAAPAFLDVPGPRPETAVAQPGPRGGGGGNGEREQREITPPIDRDEVEAMATVLAFDELQFALVDALHEGYRAEYRRATEEFRDARREIIDEARLAGEWDGVRERFGTLEEEYDARTTRLRESFLDDVVAVLEDEQRKEWPRYLRDQRRRSGLDRGRVFSGESTDLLAVLNDMDLEEHPPARPLDPIIDAYARDVDALIEERDRLLEETEALDWRDEEERERMGELADRVLEQRRRLAETNRKYADTLASALPQPASETLLHRWRAESYPGIYRETPAETYLGTVRSLDTLGSEQRSRLDRIATRLESQLRDVNRELADLQRRVETELFDAARAEAEDPMMRRMVGMFTGRMQRGGRGDWMGDLSPADLFMEEDDDALRSDLMARRRGIVRSALDDLYGVLSEDQRALAVRPEIPEVTEREEQRTQVRERMARMREWMEQRRRQREQGDV